MATLDLFDVTLIGITTRDYRELRFAIERCEDAVTFRNVVVFTDEPSEFPGRTCVSIPKMTCSAEVSVHNMVTMVQFRSLFGPFSLNIHNDSWIINPEAWTEEFREFDYIGAQWPTGVVGNDGFGWKSRRFWEALACLPIEPTIECSHPADVVMCLDRWNSKPNLKCYRTVLEQLGLKWAPPDLADRFSVENRPLNGSFGFHGTHVKNLVKAKSSTPSSGIDVSHSRSASNSAPPRKPQLLAATVWAYCDRPLASSPLQQSCDVLGVKLSATQIGKPFVTWGFNKLKAFFDEVKDVPFSHILFADGDDAFLRRDPRSEIPRLLELYGTDFLCGAEAACWPWPQRHRNRFPVAARCRYPNAGVWCATRDGFVREFGEMIELQSRDPYEEAGWTLKTNDQPAFYERAIAGGLKVDHDERLVFNLNNLVVSDRDIFHHEGLLLHGSGRAKILARRHASLMMNSRTPRFGDPSHANHPLDRTVGLQELILSLPFLRKVVEVGCFAGVSTECFAILCGHVACVDGWDGRESKPMFASFDRRMAPYKNISVIQERSPHAARHIANASVDLVYIDADHSYEAVLADIAAWLPKIRSGGWIAGHDFGWKGTPGVTQAVMERFGEPLVFADCSWLVPIS
jgi:predicted O-methyltransferase YrrM